MTDAFEPRNVLEHKLLDAQEGRLTGELFIEQLLDAQVFVPVQETLKVGGIQSGQQAQPLLVDSDDGGRVLVMFTNPERAKPFVANRPDYSGGILAEFRWVVERMGQGLGIALNPGWSVGMDMEPELLKALTGAGGDGDGARDGGTTDVATG